MPTSHKTATVYDVEGRRVLIQKAAQHTADFFSRHALENHGIQNAVQASTDYNIYQKLAEAYFREVDEYKARHNFGKKLINNAKIAGLMVHTFVKNSTDGIFIVNESARSQSYELFCALDIVYRLVRAILACKDLPQEYREEFGICLLHYKADPEWICLGKHGLRLKFGDLTVQLDD